MKRQRSPSRIESWYPILLVSAAVLAVVSAAFAAYHWSRRGVCIDSAVCATISVLLVLAIVLLLRRAAALRRAQSLSQRPIFLVTVSGPRKGKAEKEIRGKMPDDLHR